MVPERSPGRSHADSDADRHASGRHCNSGWESRPPCYRSRAASPSPILSVITLDPDRDLSGQDSTEIYGAGFDTHIAAGSPRKLDFVNGLFGAAIHKGAGQAGNLIGELLFSGCQGPGTVVHNFGLAVAAGGGWGSTGTITDNVGVAIVTGIWGEGGSIQNDTSLLVQTPYTTFPIDTHYGIYVEDQNAAQTTNYAIYSAGGNCYFNGDVTVTGMLSKGGGSFKIDHPLDPENKYLYHSFVESPDMMNIYNGNVVTDERGYATIRLPAWFEALNRDFRYQLTVMDESDSESFVNAKVVRKIADNQFTIRTSQPEVEVSWLVTGVRNDAFAQAHRIPVEEAKPERAHAWRRRSVRPHGHHHLQRKER